MDKAVRFSVLQRLFAGVGALACTFSNPDPGLLRAPEDVLECATSRLTKLLAESEPIDRIGMVADLATSESPIERVVIAAALRDATPIVGRALAIEQLAADDHPRIRSVALQAAASHYEENPIVYGRIAEQLATDPDDSIRLDAKRVLESHLAG